MDDIYTWSSDMYPLVKKYFDERYAQRIDYIGQAAGIVKQEELSYSLCFRLRRRESDYLLRSRARKWDLTRNYR